MPAPLYHCPACLAPVAARTPACPQCGTVLDWRAAPRAPLWAQITFGILLVPVVLFLVFIVLPFLLGFCRAFIFGA